MNAFQLPLLDALKIRCYASKHLQNPAYEDLSELINKKIIETTRKVTLKYQSIKLQYQQTVGKQLFTGL
jgi:hypothetical protein